MWYLIALSFVLGIAFCFSALAFVGSYLRYLREKPAGDIRMLRPLRRNPDAKIGMRETVVTRLETEA